MTNQIDPLERRMVAELPRQLDRAVRAFDAAAIAESAITPGRPSILRMSAVAAVIAIAAITAVVAVEGLSGAWRQPGSPFDSSATPRASTEPAAHLDYSEPRGVCRRVLDPNIDVEWAGYGHLVDLGLLERDVRGPDVSGRGDGPGHIWVGIASGELYVPQGERVFCMLAETPEGEVVNGDLVPDGWQSP